MEPKIKKVYRDFLVEGMWHRSGKGVHYKNRRRTRKRTNQLLNGNIDIDYIDELEEEFIEE